MKSFSVTDKKKIINQYHLGKSVGELCNQFNIPRSTMYYWIKNYSEIKRPSGEITDATQIYLLEKHIKRLEAELAIWKNSGCSINSPTSQKLEAIMLLHETYGVHAACETLGVRRSTFYHHQRRKPEKTMVQKEDDILKPEIKRIFQESKGRLGAKKIRVKLMHIGFQASSARIVRLMKEMQLTCISSGNVKRPRRSGTRPYYKNKLKQKFTQTEPNKVWVSDITYLHTDKRTYYLCVNIDLFSRKVVSYTLSDSFDVSIVIKTFKKAYAKRKPIELMYHSDQGTQYTAYKFN